MSYFTTKEDNLIHSVDRFRSISLALSDTLYKVL